MIYSTLSAPIIYCPPTPWDRLRAWARVALGSLVVASVGIGVPWVLTLGQV